MADYNVNMKQWNGSSFDNVLPLAYNAKQLGGKTYKEILSGLDNTFGKIAVGSYTGNGTYGATNPNTLTFDFKPKFVLIYNITSRWEGSYGNTLNYPKDVGHVGGVEYIGLLSSGTNSMFVIPAQLLGENYQAIYWSGTRATITFCRYARVVGNTLNFYSTLSKADQFNNNESEGNYVIPNYVYIAFG